MKDKLVDLLITLFFIFISLLVFEVWFGMENMNAGIAIVMGVVCGLLGLFVQQLIGGKR